VNHPIWSAAVAHCGDDARNPDKSGRGKPVVTSDPRGIVQVKQIDPKSPQFPPTSQHGGTEPQKLRDHAARPVDPALFAEDFIEEHDFDSARAEAADEDVVLIEKNYWLESGSINSRCQIEERLVGATDGAILVTLDNQHARRARIAMSAH
jgi:hypothetical protein